MILCLVPEPASPGEKFDLGCVTTTTAIIEPCDKKWLKSIKRNNQRATMRVFDDRLPCNEPVVILSLFVLFSSFVCLSMDR